MEAHNVSCWQNLLPLNNKNNKTIQETLVKIEGFDESSGELKFFSNYLNGKYIKAKIRVVNGKNAGKRFSYIIHTSGYFHPQSKAEIKQILEQSGIAKKGNYHSYSIKSYQCLTGLIFPQKILSKHNLSSANLYKHEEN